MTTDMSVAPDESVTGAVAAPGAGAVAAPAAGTESGAERQGQRPRLQRWRRRREPGRPSVAALDTPAEPPFDIAPNDPILAYLASAHGAVDIEHLDLDSPALRDMRAAGVTLVVPLVSSGELIGLLNLGPRLSERGYSTDDRRLLDTLARYAAPAIRVGQLVLQQEAEAREHERIEQELQVAQLIQQQFLPHELPHLPGWHVAAFYRPARTVGGDFYDFIELPNGRVLIVEGDVTDKGVPAALVMASTHALLRETAPRLLSPGAILARVNELLVQDIPSHMFVTCLALVLDPRTGEVAFANAGHNLPYVRGADGVRELHARGMPLGLMPDMSYDEHTTVLDAGEMLLVASDGLAEAHDPNRQMFGFERIATLVGQVDNGSALIDLCMSELTRFTGEGTEQEDDITLVTLQRSAAALLVQEAAS
jgi:serine phosphatase RsbU (regulator of sigma subunit)